MLYDPLRFLFGGLQKGTPFLRCLLVSGYFPPPPPSHAFVSCAAYTYRKWVFHHMWFGPCPRPKVLSTTTKKKKARLALDTLLKMLV